MEIITVAIQKGGVGKTTTAAVLAQAAAYRGQRVLAIDFDPQANLTFAMRGRAEGNGSYGLLVGDPAEDLIQTTESGVDLIPANWGLSTVTSGKGSARRLQKALKPIRGRYDLILIDTPSMVGELQYNALQASTGLIIPAEADIYNLQSVYQMADTARPLMQSNPELRILGFILTRFDGRSGLSKEMQKTIAEQAESMGIPYLGTVRAGIAVKEAAAFQKSLYEYAPKSNPAQDYLAIYDRLASGSTKDKNH